MQQGEQQHILITGGTGTLGAHLIQRLLRASKATIFCVVRAQQVAEGNVRLSEALNAYGADSRWLEEHRDRIQIIPADFSDGDFADTVKRALGERPLNLIYHCGALTNLFASAKKHLATNLEGSKNVHALTETFPEALLCYASTYAIFGEKLYGNMHEFSESDLEVGQCFPKMPYQESKFLTESFLRSQKQKPVILRVGNVFGEAQEGRILQRERSPHRIFYDALKTGMESGIGIHSSVLFDISPVDWLTEAMVALGKDEFRGETFHLLNPSAATFLEVSAHLKHNGKALEILSPTAFQKFIEQYPRNTSQPLPYALKAFRYLLMSIDDLDFSIGARVSTTRTAQTLRRLGVKDPLPPTELLKLYV